MGPILISAQTKWNCLQNFLSGKRVDSRPPPYFLKFRSSKGFILATICVAAFTDIFLYGVIVPVIPFALTHRVHIEQAAVQQWVSLLLAIYGAGLLVTSPFAGWYADRSSSRRLPLLMGLVVLLAATILLCFARSIGLLVLGRFLQGCSAAVVWTVGLALLVDTVGQENIGEKMGYVTICMGMGIPLAPLLGGIVYKVGGYFDVYWMSFAMIGLDIVMRLTLIEKKIAKQWDLDNIRDAVPRADDDWDLSEATSVHSTSAVPIEERFELKALHEHDARSISTPSTLPLAASTTHSSLTQTDIGLIAAHKPSPRIRFRYPPFLTLLKSRRLLAALWGCAVQASLLSSFDAVLPLFVKETFHWGSIAAGVIFLAMFVPSLTSPLIGIMADRYGSRWLAVTGFLLAIPPWILLRLVTHHKDGQVILLCALLAWIGMALTLVMPPLLAEVTYVVAAKEKKMPGRFGTGAYAQAYGLFVMSFALGTIIGPLWAGGVKQAAGWGTMSLSLGLFSLSGAIPCAIWTGGRISQSPNDELYVVQVSDVQVGENTV